MFGCACRSPLTLLLLLLAMLPELLQAGDQPVIEPGSASAADSWPEDHPSGSGDPPLEETVRRLAERFGATWLLHEDGDEDEDEGQGQGEPAFLGVEDSAEAASPETVLLQSQDHGDSDEYGQGLWSASGVPASDEVWEPGPEADEQPQAEEPVRPGGGWRARLGYSFGAAGEPEDEAAADAFLAAASGAALSPDAAPDAPESAASASAAAAAPDGVSLAFVFDTTGSMHDDLEQVKRGTQGILRTVLATEQRPVRDFVLVPFHDPKVGPALVTSDHATFTGALDAIKVAKGGDCPEMSLGGVKLALQRSQPRSFVYVFTDASAKDTHELGSVLALVQRKRSQVVFVLTGDCGSREDLRYRAYEKIADTSAGQVFHLNKTDVEEVLEFVRQSLHARRVNLLAVSRDHGAREELPLLVDGALDEITIALAGANPRLELEDPRGRPLAQPRLQPVLSLSNVQVVKVEQPDPGRWTVRAASDSEHSLRSTGTSRTDFRFGFSISPAQSVRESSHRPYAGIPNRLVVEATHFDSVHNLTSVKLVNMEGIPIQEVALNPVESERLHGAYHTEPFVPPPDIFYIEVLGLDNDGHLLKRVTPTAISAQQPVAPLVTMKSKIAIPVGNKGTISCYVESLVPFTVMWFKDDIPYDNRRAYEHTADVFLTLHNMTESMEGQYTCLAINSVGSTKKHVKLHISGPPPLISALQKIESSPGQTVVLDCLVDSPLNYSLTWQRFLGSFEDPKQGKTWSVKNDSRVYIPTSNQLVIESARPDDEGWYKCIAESRGGSAEGHTFLQVRDPVHIVVHPVTLEYQQGDTITISCRAMGTPLPTIYWQKDGKLLKDGGEEGRIGVVGSVSQSEILISDADESDEGHYQCHAANGIESDIGVVEVRYVEPPLIRAHETDVYASIGETVLLQCESSGIPPPIIVWLKDGELLPDGKTKLLPDGALQLLSAGTSDSGAYSCEAHNPVGSSEDTIQLHVGSKPHITQALPEIMVDFMQNGSLPCSATGKPTPQISWLRADGRNIDPARFVISSFGTLHILGAHIEDGGKYICKVKNRFGSSEFETSVKITGIEKPILQHSGAAERLRQENLGSNVELPCVILLGQPKPQLMWYRDGIPLDAQELEEDGLLLRDNGTLFIPYLTQKHAATYECVASNAAGSASKDITVQVMEAPSFSTKRTSELYVLRGEDIVLPCDAIGEPKPHVIWEKDHLLVSPSDRIVRHTDDSLLVQAALPTDSGIYTCIATNPAGTSKRSTLLTVQSPPTVFSGPESVVAVEGQLLSLTCDAKGEPHPYMEWWHNGKPLTENLLEVTYMKRNATIRFVAAAHTSGTFTCVAINPVGKDSSDIKLSVMVPPNIYPPFEEQISVSTGESVTLDCQVIGSPPPKVYWQKNWEDLNIEEGIILHEEGTLKILNVTHASAGVYVCDAENDVGISQKIFYITVNERPHIKESLPMQIHLIEGEDLSLPCSAVGDPAPDIHWLKDGQNVVALGSDNALVLEDGTLMLHAADHEHSGLYSCVAENKHGVDQRNHLISVLVPPSMIEADDTEIHVQEGQQVIIACPAMYAIPSPSIEWLKDGRLIDPLSGRVELIDEHRALRVKEARPADRGTYWCVATNPAGRNSAAFHLDILTVPTFTNSDIQSLQHIVEIGQSVTLRCNAQGHPTPWVKWRKGQHPVTVHTAPGVVLSRDKQTLHISNVRLHDAGQYQCTVTNSIGSADRVFTISVIKPPTIHGLDTEFIEATSGTVVTLQCTLSGLPEPTISWSKNGMESSIEEMSQVLISPDRHLLEIPSVQAGDGGIYICEGHNEAGFAQKTFNLTVIDPPSISDINATENLSILEGSSVVLECKIKGHPSPQVLWMHNGHILPAEEKINSTPLSLYVLHIKHVQTTQVGIYTCLASNSAGVAEKNFHLHVMVAPRLMEEPRDSADVAAPIGTGLPSDLIERVAGMPVTLHCPVEGNPLPAIEWFKDNQSVNTSIIIATGNTLYISHSTLHHSGNYTCVARNEAGSATRTFQVQIQEPPSATGATDPVKLLSGHKLTLYCEVSGTPSPQVLWYKGSMPITNGHWPYASLMKGNSTLVIPNISVKHNGQYSCFAVNKAGTAEHTFHVIVQEPPHLPAAWPKNSTHKVKLNRRLVLKCVLQGTPPPTISWYKDGYKLSDVGALDGVHISSDRQQLHVLQARIQDAGIYKCRAENSAGSQELSFIVDVQALAHWSEWSLWSECSTSCGPGEQVRRRNCGDPNADDTEVLVDCFGNDEEWRHCHMAECQVNGAWSKWSAWTSCSESCGRGTRRRYRKCDNPVPMYGGTYCIGSDSQQEYCWESPCPVNGKWSEWTEWTACSVTCDNGVQHRTRQCINPPPAHGGKNCSGSALEVINCNSHECPQDGGWSNWSKWTPCSSSCGTGNKQRTRTCNNPLPLYGGANCHGENLQISHCTIRSCENIPIMASLHIRGKINGEELTDNIIAANISEEGHRRTIHASSSDILKQQAGWFPYLTFLLSPVSWNTAKEQDEANNGYSLTQGRFKQESVVEFASGEGITLKHIGHGADDKGTLRVDIEVTGQIPILEPTAEVVINPFEEDYVQTSPNSLFASSAGSFKINGKKLPYTWNNTVSYDSVQGTMPYLVEKLSAEDINADYDPEKHEIKYKMSSAVSRKYSRDTCPEGFTLDKEHMHCRDINECLDRKENRCHVTQVCENVFGTYRCACQRGFRSAAIGKRCVDINECLQIPPACSHRCRNTRGSFRCLCPLGMALMEDERTCSDLQFWDYSDASEAENYVVPIQRSHRGSKHKRPKSVAPIASDEQWNCPSGFHVIGGVCLDIDECTLGGVCSEDETCLNVKGGFRCLETPCPPDYERDPGGGFCRKFCDTSPCENGAKISQTMTHLVVTPDGEAVHPYQDLAQLSVQRDDGHELANTRFRITENESGKPFRVRFENEHGVLYSLKTLPLGRIYKVAVLALSYDETEANVLYTTKFIIYIYLPDD